jgi:hypothetical protein
LNDDACLQFLGDLLTPCARERNIELKKYYAKAIYSLLAILQENMRSSSISSNSYEWRKKARAVYEKVGCADCFSF